ncbi:MAG: endonuclease domain-containing protein [Eubacteriales bacterium]
MTPSVTLRVPPPSERETSHLAFSTPVSIKTNRNTTEGVSVLETTDGITMSLPYNHNNISRAKNLRKHATRQENHLWYDFLRQYPVRFQRQKSIDHFIADFYCHQAKLIIEIDGSQHFLEQNKKYDEFRTEILTSYHLTVIRFTNVQIDQNFNGVCQYIQKIVCENLE